MIAILEKLTSAAVAMMIPNAVRTTPASRVGERSEIG